MKAALVWNCIHARLLTYTNNLLSPESVGSTRKVVYQHKAHSAQGNTGSSRPKDAREGLVLLLDASLASGQHGGEMTHREHSHVHSGKEGEMWKALT